MNTLVVGGRGPHLLWVHGYHLCGPFYRPLAEQLAQREVRSTLVTLPGFLREPPLANPSWSSLTDALLSAVDPRAPPCVLVGHSLGGVLALLAATRAPSWLRGVVLLEPALFPSRAVARVAAWRYRRRVLEQDEGAGFDNHNGGMRRVHDLARYPPEALALFDEARRSADAATGRALIGALPSLYPLPFARVRVPALVINGAEAGPLSAWMGWWLTRQLGAERVVVKGAAHWLVHEADVAVADAVAPFAHRVCNG